MKLQKTKDILYTIKQNQKIFLDYSSKEGLIKSRNSLNFNSTAVVEKSNETFEKPPRDSVTGKVKLSMKIKELKDNLQRNQLVNVVSR